MEITLKSGWENGNNHQECIGVGTLCLLHPFLLDDPWYIYNVMHWEKVCCQHISNLEPQNVPSMMESVDLSWWPQGRHCGFFCLAYLISSSYSPVLVGNGTDWIAAFCIYVLDSDLTVWNFDCYVNNVKKQNMGQSHA